MPLPPIQTYARLAAERRCKCPWHSWLNPRSREFYELIQNRIDRYHVALYSPIHNAASEGVSAADNYCRTGCGNNQWGADCDGRGRRAAAYQT